MDDVRRFRRRRDRAAGTDQFAAALDAARAGDAAGFETLFRLLDRRIHAFARIRGAADPEGLVNEAFLRVFQNLPRFEGGETAFTGWVFTIARNLLIDESRRRERRPVETAYDPQRPKEAVGGNTEDDAVQGLANDELVGRLAVLTADQRDVILLRVVGDLSLAATADVLGKPVGAVKSLQRRAIAALAREFSADPYPDDAPLRSW